MELYKKIIDGDIEALSKGITLLESTLEIDKKRAENLLLIARKQNNKSIRIGITGVPGVGKSTFIENFGQHWINKNKKVAVLAIDPTSNSNKGSILGDKSRMHNLASQKNAFIRPSPTSGTLGGVAEKTFDSISLCEAAGYDIILVETVGVGQNEFLVEKLVDIVILLMLPNAGDELQAIKRGIMEYADIIAVNKCDEENKMQAMKSMMLYNDSSVSIQSKNYWTKKVVVCSALENTGIGEILNLVIDYNNIIKSKETNKILRKDQKLFWFHKKIKEELGLRNYRLLVNDNKIKKIEERYLKSGITLDEILSDFC
jgi:LAO/AO transport system kinase